jgi:hypothetical protein
VTVIGSAEEDLEVSKNMLAANSFSPPSTHLHEEDELIRQFCFLTWQMFICLVFLAQKKFCVSA